MSLLRDPSSSASILFISAYRASAQSYFTRDYRSCPVFPLIIYFRRVFLLCSINYVLLLQRMEHVLLYFGGVIDDNASGLLLRVKNECSSLYQIYQTFFLQWTKRFVDHFFLPNGLIFIIPCINQKEHRYQFFTMTDLKLTVLFQLNALPASTRHIYDAVSRLIV